MCRELKEAGYSVEEPCESATLQGLGLRVSGFQGFRVLGLRVSGFRV